MVSLVIGLVVLMVNIELFTRLKIIQFSLLNFDIIINFPPDLSK